MSPTPDVGCLICSEPPDSETQHQSHLQFGEKTYKAVLTKIFQYLLLPSQDAPMLYWMCRDERFCSRCLEMVEEIEEYQSKIQALELALQHKVEGLGKVIATSKKYNEKDFERRNLRNASEKATELWSKFRSPVITSFKKGLLPATKVDSRSTPSSTSTSTSTRQLPLRTRRTEPTEEDVRTEPDYYGPSSSSPSFDVGPNNEVSMDGFNNSEGDDDFDNTGQSMGDFVDPDSDEDEDYKPSAPKKRTIRTAKSSNSSKKPVQEAPQIRPFSITDEIVPVTPGLRVFASARGKYMITFNNFLYVFRGIEKTCIGYRCCQHNYGCKARLRVSFDYTTVTDDSGAFPDNHDHESEPENCERKYAVWRMRREAVLSADSDVNGIVLAKIQDLGPECIDTLPQLESVRRSVRRIKHLVHGKPPRKTKYKQRKPKVPNKRNSNNSTCASSASPPAATVIPASEGAPRLYPTDQTLSFPVINHTIEQLQYHHHLL